jgi:excisionase family DNA binding protein
MDNGQEIPSELLTAASIARILNVTSGRVYQLWHEGRIPPGFTLGKRRYIRRAEWDAWLEKAGEESNNRAN